MGALLVGMFVVMFVAAAYQYVSIIPFVESVLPPQFKENGYSSFALDTYVWSPQVPEIARRRYVRSFGLMTFACAMLAFYALFRGQSERVLAASVFTAVFAWFFVTRWLKYRALRRMS